MSQVLLETLVGAVDALEKKTKTMQGEINGLPDHSENLSHLDDRLSATEAEVKSLPDKIFMPFQEIEMLTAELRKHRQILAIPLKQEVRHEHHVSMPVLISIVLFLAIVGLLSLQCYTWQEADRHKQNDMKYRYLKAFQPPEGQRILHQVDSLYDSNPDEFRKAVHRQEATKQEQFEDFQRVQEKQEEIKNLQKKWNR